MDAIVRLVHFLASAQRPNVAIQMAPAVVEQVIPSVAERSPALRAG